MMRRIGLVSIALIWFCLSCVSTAFGRDDDDSSAPPKPVPRDVVHIEAYKKYAGESDITETVEFISRNPAMSFQILDGSYKKLPEVIVKGA